MTEKSVVYELRPAMNGGRGFVIWRIDHLGGGFLTRTRRGWFPDHDAARGYIARHSDLNIKENVR